MIFHNVHELVELCEKNNMEVWQVMLEQEAALAEISPEEAMADIAKKVKVMEASIESGIQGVVSYSGLSGGDAKKLAAYQEHGDPIVGSFMLDAIKGAIAVNEVNASMGIICATPTAGSAGVLPGLLYACSRKRHLSEEAKVRFLLTAGAFGLCVGNQSPIAGASGGCQAEIGTASGMGAAAVTYIEGGSPQASADAIAIALKNILGLVCDPVAGLVEIPCIKRNAMGVANAVAAAEMALAGIKSAIPADEVIGAMANIGSIMPAALRETAMGGLAVTPTGKKYARQLEEKKAALVDIDTQDSPNQHHF